MGQPTFPQEWIHDYFMGYGGDTTFVLADFTTDPPTPAQPITTGRTCERCHKVFDPTPSECIEMEVWDVQPDHSDFVVSYAYLCQPCQDADPNYADEM